jgi:hypothetical protein
MAKLQFDLIDSRDEDSLEDRRDKIRTSTVGYISKQYVIWNTPGDLLMSMRAVSGEITEHLRVTKDKTGSYELMLNMLTTALDIFEPMLMEKQKRCDTFSPYFAKRLHDVIEKIQKLHEDYHLDYREAVMKCVAFVRQHPPTLHEAKKLGTNIINPLG